MMTGGTVRHPLVAGNLFALLRGGLDGKRWAVLGDFGIDERPGTIRYADIVVDVRGAEGDARMAKAPRSLPTCCRGRQPQSISAAEYLQLSSLVGYHRLCPR
jgi:hypothetical protein